jgi:hypothetical protein
VLEAEGARARDLAAEGVGVEGHAHGLPADGLVLEVDLEFGREARPGDSEMRASPSSTVTGASTSIARRGAACSIVPAQSTRKRNGAEEPSMTGTSSASSSTIRLSIWAP